MKPAPFDYLRPASVAEAIAAMTDDDARLIAGGQTLIPMLAMRLARPSLLIDISRLEALRGIVEDGDVLSIGAATRQAEAERSALVAATAPLLARALPWVGHPPTRGRGTVGGSIANADPSAELPLVAVVLDATLVLQDADGEQQMAAEDFFFGPMVTAMPEGGCLKSVRFPIWRGARIGTGFHEISARRSDFAFVSAAAQVELDAGCRCVKVSVGVGGVGDRPTRLSLDRLIGDRLSDAAMASLVVEATAELETVSDLHASGEYRRRVAGVLATRALADAIGDAGGRA